MKIGVTGHRPKRIDIGLDRIEARVTEALHLLLGASHVAEAGAKPIEAISALAEGADRVFAKAALAVGCELHAVLPFASPEYETTFSDASELPAYFALLAQAKTVTELAGTLADADVAYEVAGRLIADQSDVLFCVWDGQPAAGRGGTPEIIQYALSNGRSVVWIDASRDRSPLLLEASITDAFTLVDIDAVAHSAATLTQHLLERVFGQART